MASRKLEVEIIGDASSLERAFGKASSSGSSFGSTLGKLGKAAAFATGAAALGGIALVLKEGIGEFSESAKVTAQTGAVLKSTGEAANVTAKQVSELSTTLEHKSGVDDEVIQSGENMLLTFTNIRNEVGKGNDIFTQSTSVLLDMSTALGQDMTKSAIQLGKALNDPVKGIGALRRVGVAFTEAQQNQIDALVKSGHTMEAQKIILGELNREFGGSAEAAGKTLPGQLSILKNSFDDLAGNLIGKAVPAVTSFVGFLNEKGVPALSQVFSVVSEKVGPILTGLGDTFRTVGPAILGVLEPIVAVIGEKVVPIFKTLQGIATEAIQKIAAIIKENGPQLRQIFENLGIVIGNLAKIVIPLLDFAFTKVLPVAIKILIPILVTLTAVLAKTSEVVAAVAAAFTRAFQAVSAAVLRAWAAVRPTIQAIGAFIQAVVDIVVGLLTGDWSRAWSGARAVVIAAVHAIQAIIEGLGGLIRQAINAAATAAYQGAISIGKAIIAGILSGLGNIKDAVIGALLGPIRDAVSFVKDHAGSTLAELSAKQLGTPMGEGTVGGAMATLGTLGTQMAQKIREQIAQAKAAVAEAQGAFADAFAALADAALAAFDARVSAWVPPAQKMLDKMRAEDAAKQIADQVTAAKDAVLAAQAAFAALKPPDLTRKEGESDEDFAKRQADALAAYQVQLAEASAAIIKAEDDLQAALRAKREFTLEQRATKEQAAHDKHMKQRRRHLMEDLAQVEEWLDKHPQKWKEAQDKILAVLDKYHIKGGPFWNEGLAFAEAIKGGMESKLEDLKAAAGNLASAVAGVPVGANMASGFKDASEQGTVLAKTLNTQLTPAASNLKDESQKTKELWTWFATSGITLWKKASKDLPPLINTVTDPLEHMRAVLVGIRNAMKDIIDKAKDFASAMKTVTEASGGTPPGRQQGGPVTRGQAYVVGEAGPELFIPGSNGQVVPSGSFGTARTNGGGTTINMSFPNYVGSKQELVETVRRGLYEIGLRNPGTGLAM